MKPCSKFMVGAHIRGNLILISHLVKKDLTDQLIFITEDFFKRIEKKPNPAFLNALEEYFQFVIFIELNKRRLFEVRKNLGEGFSKTGDHLVASRHLQIARKLAQDFGFCLRNKNRKKINLP